ncbi:MAG: hypothetical protein JXA54_06270 [Candidatus Heimdallarchaeota archaeon]|nr:hypothetical protein [Candidatus Heimdallarchaeota archaeon]
MPKRIALSTKQITNTSKVVTMRDLDKELFEQFSSLTKTWGKNIGEIFSRLLKNFLELGSTSIFIPSFENRLKQLQCTSLEVIENLDELLIDALDLSSLPKGVKFFFNNIQHLVFSDTITANMLLEYVFCIKNSLVISSSNFPKIPYLSLFQKSSEYPKNKREFKDVTIRNVNTNIWNDFIAHCSLNQRKVSEVINHILWDIIPEMEITQISLRKVREPLENLFLISGHDKINITQKDLQEIVDKKVIFHRIADLTFESDITQGLFIEKVIGIYNCPKVIFPEKFSKLLKLSRSKLYPQ